MTSGTTSQHGGKAPGPWRLAWRRFSRSRMAVVGATLVAIALLAAIFAPWLASYSYSEQQRNDSGEGPSMRHLLGADSLGRDVLSRVLFGARASLQVAVAATAVAVFLGVAAGAFAGYLGGWTDEIVMRAADSFSAFPGILLAVAITAAFDQRSLVVVFLALGLVGWSALARIVRGQVLTLREEDFVHAARALGVGNLRIIFRHILPNCFAPIIVTATVLMAGNILGEAGLSFLGIGVQPPAPSWGSMLQDARDAVLLPHGNQPFRYWWLGAFPGAAIALTVLGFNLLGDGLRDALDPREAEKSN